MLASASRQGAQPAATSSRSGHASPKSPKAILNLAKTDNLSDSPASTGPKHTEYSGTVNSESCSIEDILSPAIISTIATPSSPPPILIPVAAIIPVVSASVAKAAEFVSVLQEEPARGASSRSSSPFESGRTIQRNDQLPATTTTALVETRTLGEAEVEREPTDNTNMAGNKKFTVGDANNKDHSVGSDFVDRISGTSGDDDKMLLQVEEANHESDHNVTNVLESSASISADPAGDVMVGANVLPETPEAATETQIHEALQQEEVQREDEDEEDEDLSEETIILSALQVKKAVSPTNEGQEPNQGDGEAKQEGSVNIREDDHDDNKDILAGLNENTAPSEPEEVADENAALLIERLIALKEAYVTINEIKRKEAQFELLQAVLEKTYE
ncbi:hypothetical protein HK102_002779, partial [Quaeritorhiza haematococci]